ncbi:sigma factor-like helix-turn-helix DNA-binding protein [Roseateles sp. MS654]|uniref:sigma factor-like helix-turn-helix DNA-binding protein n=1 Tax=Roseateles sp. MS654 TaxID=3412685 RepID=UPI003C2C6157
MSEPNLDAVAVPPYIQEKRACIAAFMDAMDSESAHRPRDASMDVSQQVAYRQLAGIVDVTLSGLSPDLRGTFDLACLQEESYRDVAEIQAIPIGTVRSRVNRVRTLLRSRLKQGFADYAT